MKRYNVLLAGGGTAGHIEPALAVAREWKLRHPEAQITFLGTKDGLETRLIPEAGFPLHLIPKVAISRSLSPSLLRVPFQLISAIFQSSRALNDVDCAIGFGGYVSAPLYIAAWFKRTPYVIHEQNAKPGWANKLGALLTKNIAISYPVFSGPLKMAELTGLPLRADVIQAASTTSWEKARSEAKAALCEKYGLNSSLPLIFIFGGSQGSQAINKVVTESLSTLTSFSIIHGVGRKNLQPPTTSTYRAVDYIEDMALHYLAADLIIGRSGAVTCAEVSALGRFALFIPLPVGNGEQALNAKTLVEAGRAEICLQSNFSSGWLSQNVARLIQTSASRGSAGNADGVRAVVKIADMMERALKS